jgi:hypothetical protein
MKGLLKIQESFLLIKNVLIFKSLPLPSETPAIVDTIGGVSSTEVLHVWIGRCHLNWIAAGNCKRLGNI